jgi:hypothetical protein
VNSLNLKIATRTNLNFQRRKPTKAIGAKSFRARLRHGGSGWIGR